jgi:hypothetical protein
MMSVPPPIPLHCTFRSFVNLIPSVVHRSFLFACFSSSFLLYQPFRGEAHVSIRNLSKGFFNRLERFRNRPITSIIGQLSPGSFTNVQEKRNDPDRFAMVNWQQETSIIKNTKGASLHE